MYFNQIMKLDTRAFSSDGRVNDERRGACRRGGRRFTAGRRFGYSNWGEKTVVMHVPLSRVEQVITLLESKPIEML